MLCYVVLRVSPAQTEDPMRGGVSASSWSSCSWDDADADTSTWQLPASGWRSPDQHRYQWSSCSYVCTEAVMTSKVMVSTNSVIYLKATIGKFNCVCFVVFQIMSFSECQNWTGLLSIILTANNAQVKYISRSRQNIDCNKTWITRTSTYSNIHIN